ncbi:hypothetical protein ACF06V_34295 [Streptomyces bobili]
MRSDRLTATERAMLHTARARAFGKMRDVANTLPPVRGRALRSAGR